MAGGSDYSTNGGCGFAFAVAGEDGNQSRSCFATSGLLRKTDGGSHTVLSSVKVYQQASAVSRRRLHYFGTFG
jgi:hypothetical protein